MHRYTYITRTYKQTCCCFSDNIKTSETIQSNHPLLYCLSSCTALRTLTFLADTHYDWFSTRAICTTYQHKSRHHMHSYHPFHSHGSTTAPPHCCSGCGNGSQHLLSSSHCERTPTWRRIVQAVALPMLDIPILGCWLTPCQDIPVLLQTLDSPSLQ